MVVVKFQPLQFSLEVLRCCTTLPCHRVMNYDDELMKHLPCSLSQILCWGGSPTRCAMGEEGFVTAFRKGRIRIYLINSCRGSAIICIAEAGLVSCLSCMLVVQLLTIRWPWSPRKVELCLALLSAAAGLQKKACGGFLICRHLSHSTRVKLMHRIHSYKKHVSNHTYFLIEILYRQIIQFTAM